MIKKNIKWAYLKKLKITRRWNNLFSYFFFHIIKGNDRVLSVYGFFVRIKF